MLTAWLRRAMKAAAKANNTDFTTMPGNTATAGIPNKAELTSGESTAVSSPSPSSAACGRCASGHRCAFDDDQCNELIEKLLEADAVVVGTPVYFAGPNGALCALLDRAFYAAANYGQLLAGKPACAVATCWRAGATPSIDRINKYFTFSQMPVVSSEYWNGYLGPRDSFGAGVLKTLAANMADLLRKE